MPSDHSRADDAARTSSGVVRFLVSQADRAVLRAGVAILCLVPISVAGALLDGRTLDGAQVWLKPLKFQISVGIYLLTLAIMISLATERFRRSIAGRATVWTAISTSLFEIAWITLQAARAERSHYATDTAFGQVMYALMGIGAVLLSLTPVVFAIAAWSSRSNDSSLRPLRWGVGLGAMVTLLGAAGVGILLGGSPDHYPEPGTDPAEDPRVALAGWSTTGGDLRIAHFVGLHAMQGIPLLSLLLLRIPHRVAIAILITIALAWAAAIVILAQLALSDHAPWPLAR
ncbi:MAG: hypothetical protein AAGG07_01050 [Planctomycetota bacterium]